MVKAAVALIAICAPLAIGIRCHAVQPQPKPDAAAREGDPVARAKAAVDRAKTAYAALKSYSATVTVKQLWKATGRDEESEQTKVSVIYQAPDRFSMQTEIGGLVCDGKTASRMVRKSKQYDQIDAPKPLDPYALVEDLSVGELVTPDVAVILRGAANPPLMLRFVKALTGSRAEVRDNVAVTVVTGTGRLDAEDSRSPETEIEMVFRDDTGLLAAVSIDDTKARNRFSDPPLWEKMFNSYTWADVVVNPAVPENAFTPPADYKKVDSIIADPAPREERDQDTLIGVAAPDFKGEDLDGKPLALADFKGRVVVLDFWATWCPPCVAGIPHVQKLSEHYAGKDVTVLGINQDGGDKAVVRKFVSGKKITFRHLMDDGDVGDKYLVTGIPCTVLIDKNGVLQHVSTGFDPTGEAALIAKIDTLLEGKDLHTPEEIAALRKKAEDKAKAGVEQLRFESVNGDLITPGERLGRSYFSHHASWIMDVDGKPGNELVNPMNEGGIEIVDSGGETIRQLRFSGLGRGRIESVAPVMLEGKRHWIVSCVSMSTSGEVVIGLYSDEGNEIWRHVPRLPVDSFTQGSVAAGDLDGDGKPEFAVALSAIRRGGRSGLQFGPKNQAGAILILSANGTLLTQRAVPDADMVFIGQSPEPGKPGKLLVAGGGRLQRMKVEFPREGEQKK